MKQFIGILLFAAILSGLSSCYSTSIEKPDQLIKKEKFVKMMVDMYLVQGKDMNFNEADSLKKITQTDLYFSVLKKYDVPDTVFVRSLLYYSSSPKEYEKLHVQIVNILNESEQQFKPKEKLNTDTK
ncbi:MAG: DUF4296 domain-containing protein [Prolixibacteraceae bacterium]|jgi:hypothetical protein|nr:DUF4296 domain-containing protein [Prolixibacteraceae bacterium]